MIFRGRVVDNADPTDAFILKVTSDRLGGGASTAWPLLLRQSGQRLPPIGANVWLSESGGVLVWLGEWVAPGSESALGVAGDGGGSGSGTVDSVEPGTSINVNSGDPAHPIVSVVRSDFGFMHEQGTPSDTWVVSHNLGYRPGGLVVMDSAGTINEPAEIIHDSINQTTIIFLYPFGGTAFLS